MRIIKAFHFVIAALSLTLLVNVQPAWANVSVSIVPQNISAFVGTNVTFSAQVNATAGETITGYTWKVSPDGGSYSTISGATGATLPLNNLQTNNSGSYFVSVTYNSGANTGLTAVSTVAVLTVQDQARLTSQPVSLIRATGKTAVFSVTTLGAQPLSYHWRANGVPLVDSGRIAGSGSATITLSGLQINDTANYDVVVSNLYAAVTSHVATLTVLAPPSIIAQTTNLDLLVGNTATLGVTTGGSAPFVFQWKKDDAILTDDSRISGATSNILNILNVTTNDNGNYTLIFSNAVGSITSAPASVLVLLPPVITSSTNALGQQGFPFHFTVTAVGSAPISFGSDILPDGLTISTNGFISGTPTVSGLFNVTLYATNAAFTASTNLLVNLITDVPGITSALTNVIGQQGSNFIYTITASNNPSVFTAAGLPAGLNFDPITAAISGFPLLNGTFPVTITAGNQFGVDTETLMLTLVTGAPLITSALKVNGTEGRTGFTYTIKATNNPVSFGAIGLPTGLILDPATGIISGTPTYGGTNTIIINAVNAYGTGSTNLVLAIAYAKITGLVITNVTSAYSAPYLLDFSFALQDANGNAVVRPPEQLAVQISEGILQDTNNQYALPLGNETAFITGSAITTKLLKTFFVLDYSYSMFITPGAIDNMQASVENLIAEEPASAQFGVVEFNADYVAPAQVTGFTADKHLLNTEIEGIQTNYVQGNYAGTRFFDALYTAVTNFTSTNLDEQHYLVLMSDGYDDSSILPVTKQNPTQADVIIAQAITNKVKIYCVGFGPNPNTAVLQQLTTATGGSYFAAATPADLSAQFALLLKDVSSQYILRWATLQRTSGFIQPMFTITTGGSTAAFNTVIDLEPTNIVDDTMSPPVTNSYLTNISAVPLYVPANYVGNVQQGTLELVPDSVTNVSSITLRATYVPRYVREFHILYRANYPCTATLLSTNTGDILAGWSLSQTNDTNGQWLTLTSPSPSNVLSSLPYGVFGDLVSFQFQYQALPDASTAFADFEIDNSVYSNLPPSGQSFVLMPTNLYITNLPPTPPFGTPVPWLIAHGFTNDFANAELLDPNNNGLTVWQDYIAGLDPRDTNSTFAIQTFLPPQTNLPPVITFNSVMGRTYRVDAATSLSLPDWTPLRDDIMGTGFPISVSDNRNLSTVNGVFYRVVVSY